MPIWGHQIDKAFDLYVKLHAKDIAPHKVELIKRDEGPPTGRGGQDRRHRTDHERQGADPLRLRVLAVGHCDRAGGDAGEDTDGHRQCRHGLDHHLSPYIVRFSFSMWHDGYPMGTYAHEKLDCKTAALAYTDFPPGKDSTEAFKTGFEKAGGKVADSIPMGSPAQVPDYHAVLSAREGSEARLPLRLHPVRLARFRLWCKTYGESV